MNEGFSPNFAAMLSNIPNVISLTKCPSRLDIKGDAGGHHACLHQASGILLEYDVVILLHCKGSSHSFEVMSPLIDSFQPKRLTVEIFRKQFKDEDVLLAGEFMLPMGRATMAQVALLSEIAGVPNPVILQIPSTIYAVSGRVLDEALKKLPIEFFNINPIENGFNR